MAGSELFQRIALIGVGLIGSSLAHVIRRDGLAAQLVGCARSQATRDAVIRLGLAEFEFVSERPA